MGLFFCWLFLRIFNLPYHLVKREEFKRTSASTYTDVNSETHRNTPSFSNGITGIDWLVLIAFSAYALYDIAVEDANVFEWIFAISVTFLIYKVLRDLLVGLVKSARAILLTSNEQGENARTIIPSRQNLEKDQFISPIADSVIAIKDIVAESDKRAKANSSGSDGLRPVQVLVISCIFIVILATLGTAVSGSKDAFGIYIVLLSIPFLAYIVLRLLINGLVWLAKPNHLHSADKSGELERPIPSDEHLQEVQDISSIPHSININEDVIAVHGKVSYANANAKQRHSLGAIHWLGIVLIGLFIYFLFFFPDESDNPDDFAKLVRINPVPQVQQLVQEEKYAEAEEYLSFFMDYDYVNQDPDAIQLYSEIQDKRGDWLYRLEKANAGFWSGESDESEGQVAAVVSDLLVIGDLRDLGREGINWIEDKDVNEVTVALSALGVAASGAVLWTAGTSETVKPFFTFLKGASKARKIPKWLGRCFVEGAEIANKTKKLDHVADSLSDIYRLHKETGARTTLTLLGKSENLEDFRRLSKFGSRFGKKTPTLLKLAGDDVITASQRMSKIPQKFFLEASTFQRDGIKALEKHGALKFSEFLDYDATRKVSKLRNGHLAGNFHPKTGVPFDGEGYPDFSRITIKTAKITPTGNRIGDYRAANAAVGLRSTPEGYTWHHHQDGETMQLVPRDIHEQTGHTGGFH